MYNSKGIKETLTPLIKKQMEDELNKVQNPIFVFLGIEQYVNIHEYERYITVMFNEDGKCKFIGNSKPNATYSSYICGVKKQFGVLGTDGEDASVFYKGRCI